MARHFNQDPLENFFGAIRSHGCRNVSPTPDGFEIAFASLLISNITTHSPGANCEQDSCSTLFKSMRALFKTSLKASEHQDIDLSYMEHNIFIEYDSKKNDPRKIAQLEYVTGYLLKQTKKNVFGSCKTCKENFVNNEKENEYIAAREYDQSKKYLQYPNENLVKLFSKTQDILMWVLRNNSNQTYIRNYAKTIMYIELNTQFFTCELHKSKNIEFMFELAARFFICNWCKEINNILKGRRKDFEEGDNMKNLALEYVRKRRKNK